MDLARNINYYHIITLLDGITRQGALTEEETRKIKRRLVEMCQPDPEYIR